MFTVLSLARVRGEAAASLACVFLYQCCYSAAPVYLSHVAAGNPDRNQMARAIIIFVLLYFLPYPFVYASTLWRVLWMSSSRRSFYERAYAATFGQVANSTSQSAEKSFNATVAANGQELVADCLYFVNGTAGLLFSSSLSVLLISLFVLRDFVITYLLSAVLCALVIWKLGAWQVRVAAATERAYNGLMAALPAAWHANSLAEKPIVAAFMRSFSRRWRLHRRVALRAMNAYQAFNLLQALCIWMPTSVLILLRLGSMSVSEMLALAIVLPRLTETLLEISLLVANITDFLSLKGRVRWLNEALAMPTIDLAPRCDFTRLKLARRERSDLLPLTLESAEGVEAILSSPGRYSLTGTNGSGKTSLLLLLKERQPKTVFYLPANASLFPAFGAKASTGQRKLRDLERSFALARGKVRLILLDEWDANLDHANRQRISEQIDELARSHAVVEVSHRTANDPPRNITS